MADANRPAAPLPNDWNEAFAALPLEQAPPHAWSQLAARLPAMADTRIDAASPRRRRRSTGMAMAAAASLAFALPLAWWLGMAPSSPVPRATGDAAVASSTAAPTAAEAHVDPGADAVGPTTGDPVTADTAASLTTASIPTRGRDAAPADARTHGSQQRHPVAATPARNEPSNEAAIEIATAVQPQPGIPNVAAEPPSDAGSRLDALRQQSARLEALVAYARDERVTSAAAAVMSASLDDRIRLIDAALMQPALGDDLRSSLWDQRVGALQELAALEGTQRWMAVHGASMDAVARVD